MSEPARHPDEPDPASLPGGEDMDALLRQWHRENTQRAAAGREALMARLRAEHGAGTLKLPPLIDEELEASLRAARSGAARKGGPGDGPVVHTRRIAMLRTWMAAAAVIVLAGVLPLLMLERDRGGFGPLAGLPESRKGPGMRSFDESVMKRASFEGYVMCPEGGRLDAVDPTGAMIGPCILKHTDVVADVSGFLTRVTLTQKYHNPHPVKVEAVYTFPLSERAAVDRMVMTVGSRVIEGQVKERAEAKRIYEQARAEGRIASLLEQERPNIFTQSIANLEPGADIEIRISYVETTKQVGGVFEFDFPTTIGPRFVPGDTVTGNVPDLREGVRPRRGLVLLAPATISELRAGDTSAGGELHEAAVSEMLRRATPIAPTAPGGNIWYSFRAAYQDGSAEYGTLYTDGVGTLNGRWFCVPRPLMPKPVEGGGFAPDTDRVPDASRVTPMPTIPPTRAGHDISITVKINTGGPALGGVDSALHEVSSNVAGDRATVTLKNASDIPNRDFVLRWRQASQVVEPAVFATSVPQGNFFAVQLIPPPIVGADDLDRAAVAREMMFVLDVSGSMRGRSIEKAKEVLGKALSALRPSDSFNIVRFQNTLEQLWPSARSATPENLAEARAFYEKEIGGGGTQMVEAIRRAYQALGQPVTAARGEPGLTALALANLPADGRRVVVDAPAGTLLAPELGRAVQPWRLRARDGLEIEVTPAAAMPAGASDGRADLRIAGAWMTRDGRRVLVADVIETVRDRQPAPVGDASRFIVFLTDGLIANDNEVLAEVRANRSKAAVFSFAIGNAPNRYLLDSMARFGRGEVEYVYESTDAGAVIDRFASRIRTPVLTNIGVEFSPNLQVLDTMTALGGGGGAVAELDAIPDLFDAKPLTIIGRYNQAATGTVTITGMTAAGPYRRTVNLDLPAPLTLDQARALAGYRAPGIENATGLVLESPSDSIATLWARAKVESVLGTDLRGVLAGNPNPSVKAEVVRLGESFNLVTQYTSFVAVDRLRVTVAGAPRLVHIPVELTSGIDPTGIFGEGAGAAPELHDDDVLLQLKDSLTEYAYIEKGKQVSYRGLEVAELRSKGEAAADQLSVPASPLSLGTAAPGNSGNIPDAAAKGGAGPSGEKSRDRDASRSERGFDAKPSRGADREAAARPEVERKERPSGQTPPPSKSDAPPPAAKAPPPPPAPSAPAQMPLPAPAGPGGTSGAPEPSPVPTIEPAKPQVVAPTASTTEVLRRTAAPADAAGRYSRLTDYPESLGEAATGGTTYFGLVQSPAAGGDGGRAGVYHVTSASADAQVSVNGLLGLYFDTLSDKYVPDTSHPGESAVERQKVVLAEHVIVRIEKLFQENKEDAAAKLAAALGDAVPKMPAAAELKRIFSDASVTPDERRQVVAREAQGARDRLEGLRREGLLRLRLEAPLLEKISAATAQGASPIGADEQLSLSVLVDAVTSVTLGELTKLGCTIDAADEQVRVVLVRCPVSKLRELALSEHVRRVESTRE